MQQLALLFKALGPQVIEIWINSTFVEAWKNSAVENDITLQTAQCVNTLLATTKTTNMKKVLTMHVQGLMASTTMSSLANEFGYPKRFEQLLSGLDKDLIPKFEKCMDMMKNAQGLEVTLLAQTFNA